MEKLDNFPLIFLLSHFPDMTICQFHPMSHLSPITQQATTGESEACHMLPLTCMKPITTSFQTAPSSQGSLIHSEERALCPFLHT